MTSAPRQRFAQDEQVPDTADRSVRLARSLGAQGTRLAGVLVRPGVRAPVIGVALIILDVLLVQHSFWTFPVAAVGVLLVLLGWIGQRLRGHFSISWGDGATTLDLHASFLSAGTPLDVHLRDAANPAAVQASIGVHQDAGEVVEGEAQTIELDDELLQRIVSAIEDHDALILAARSDSEPDAPLEAAVTAAAVGQ